MLINGGERGKSHGRPFDEEDLTYLWVLKSNRHCVRKLLSGSTASESGTTTPGSSTVLASVAIEN